MHETEGENPSLQANIETIKSLEGVDTRAKIELIFILLGEKPATEFFIQVEDSEPQKAQNIQNILIEIGLECKLSMSSPTLTKHTDNGYHYEKLEVTGNANDLNKLLTADNDRKLGQIYGFPETAIDAYVKAQQGEPVRLFSIDDLPEDIKNADYAPFCQFVFSENWLHELAVPKRWSEIAKKHAPELHERNLQSWKAAQERHRFQLEELSEPLEKELQETHIPTPYTLVNVENRWGQALPDNKVRWLDTGNEETVPWEHYKLVRKWKPEMSMVQMLAQKLHVFTPFELSHIEANEGDDMKRRTKLFGEYKKIKA